MVGAPMDLSTTVGAVLSECARRPRAGPSLTRRSRIDGGCLSDGGTSCRALLALTAQIVATQTAFYYKTFPKDLLRTKLIVGLLFVIAGAHTVLSWQTLNEWLVVNRSYENTRQFCGSQTRPALRLALM